MQELRWPNSINDSYQLLNEIRMLVKEFQRQSPTDPMPKAMVKAAYMKVVPEAYKRGLEMQIDVDKGVPFLEVICDVEGLGVVGVHPVHPRHCVLCPLFEALC